MDRSEVKMYSICQIYEDPSSLITRKKYLCPHQPPDSSIVQYTDTLKSLCSSLNSTSSAEEDSRFLQCIGEWKAPEGRRAEVIRCFLTYIPRGCPWPRGMWRLQEQKNWSKSATSQTPQWKHSKVREAERSNFTKCLNNLKVIFLCC